MRNSQFCFSCIVAQTIALAKCLENTQTGSGEGGEADLVGDSDCFWIVCA